MALRMVLFSSTELLSVYLFTGSGKAAMGTDTLSPLKKEGV